MSSGGHVKREFVSLAFTASCGTSMAPGETKNAALATIAIASFAGRGDSFGYPLESTPSTNVDTTQRCLPILRSRENPSCSYVESAPW